MSFPAPTHQSNQKTAMDLGDSQTDTTPNVVRDLLEKGFYGAEDHDMDFIAFSIPEKGPIDFLATDSLQFLLPGNTRDAKLDAAIQYARDQITAANSNEEFRGKVPKSSSSDVHKIHYAKASFPQDPHREALLASVLLKREIPNKEELKQFMDIRVDEGGRTTWTCAFPHGPSYYYGTRERTTVFKSEDGAFKHLQQYDIIVDQYLVDGKVFDTWACGGTCGKPDCKERFDGPYDIEKHRKDATRVSTKPAKHNPAKRKWNDQLDIESAFKRAKPNKNARASTSKAVVISDSDDEMEM